MGKSYKEQLPKIKTLIFDIDGVFSDGTVNVMPDGQLIRRLYIKDSYAVQYALKKGYNLALITGGNSIAIRESFQMLGVKHIFLNANFKKEVFQKFVDNENLDPDETLYMGDDIPDYEVMSMVGVAACPADASAEIKRISHYISHKKGGQGCVRDIIEQTLKVQGNWFHDDAYQQ